VALFFNDGIRQSRLTLLRRALEFRLSSHSRSPHSAGQAFELIFTPKRLIADS
jgi:hypothetical protein